MRIRPPVLFVVLTFVFALAAASCSSDDNGYDNLGEGGGGAIPGSGSAGGDDAGTDADRVDAADAGNDVDAGDEVCDEEITATTTDPRFPCCYEDRDCQESGRPGADDMRCYYASCTEDGEGTCRIPPTGDQQCWSNDDCPEDMYCPHEQNDDAFSCRTPNHVESPATCRDE